MSTILQLFGEASASAKLSRPVPEIEHAPHPNIPQPGPVRDEQLQSLIQQLFFQHESTPLRHVGFAAADASTAIGSLCLDVAHMLSQEGAHDVALIDSSPHTIPLETQLEMAPLATSDSPWSIAPHLWFVPRESWVPDGASARITEQDLLRLRDLTTEFDFSILCCPSVSWGTARIGRACDGLVLVLTANKTRRLVATHLREQLRQAQVPLLGTVLTARRFPIPAGFYRRL